MKRVGTARSATVEAAVQVSCVSIVAGQADIEHSATRLAPAYAGKPTN
jgi:hypothetical protein